MSLTAFRVSYRVQKVDRAFFFVKGARVLYNYSIDAPLPDVTCAWCQQSHEPPWPIWKEMREKNVCPYRSLLAVILTRLLEFVGIWGSWKSMMCMKPWVYLSDCQWHLKLEQETGFEWFEWVNSLTSVEVLSFRTLWKLLFVLLLFCILKKIIIIKIK